MDVTGTIAAASAPGPGRGLLAGAPGAVSIVLSPQQSVVSLLLQSASGQSWGPPAGLLPAVRDALRPRARLAARSFTTRGHTTIPDTCMPISPLADTSVGDQVARLRDLPADALIAELQAVYGGHRLPLPWRAAADQPRRWLNSMADASLDIWAMAEPLWRTAGSLLDREIRRIGIATVRGGMAALLNSLHPGLSYRDGTFTYAPPCDPGNKLGPLGPVGPRRLALVPMIAGRDALLFSFDLPGVCWIGYPIRQPRTGSPATSDGALATILGPVRAATLQALRQPLTVSDLAAAVHCAPTTATYHLHQLAAAGLITREKSGPAVWVSRTARGNELVELLSG
jgi:DNA-binding transcriptional ArsR family regulator